jgi:3-oxoacyl-[acyl-carrier-protein] synthase III
MGVKISAVEYYLPQTKVTNNDIQSISNTWTPEKIEEKIGIKNRYIVQEGETALNLATNACLKLFNNGVDKQSIDALIYCTQSPEYFLPTTACVLQNLIGLRTDTFCLDYNLGCSGYVYGLAMAKGLISIGIAKNILLVTAETYSKYISENDSINKSLFGDAATASLIINSDKSEIKEFVFGTDGSGYENLIVKDGGSKSLNKSPALLYMNGPEIFSFTNKSIPLLVEETLIKNNLTLNQIDYFIFHQANKYMLEHLRKKINIPSEKFLIDMENYGNTVSNTIPIVWSNKLKKGNDFFKNKIIMLVGFGVGYSWGATIIKN